VDLGERTFIRGVDLGERRVFPIDIKKIPKILKGQPSDHLLTI
jgi:hypothetical protein